MFGNEYNIEISAYSSGVMLTSYPELKRDPYFFNLILQRIDNIDRGYSIIV